MVHSQFCRSAILCFLAVTFAGCGRKTIERVPVFPVSGRLLVDGRPANNAQVFFHAQDRSKTTQGLPFAVAGTDGAFQAGTYLPNDGLPSGEYVVTVQWPLMTVVDGEDVAGPDQLNGLYATPERPAAKVTVAETAVEMPPIKLRSR